MGFAINDRNQTRDVEDLIPLSNSEVVQGARFKFIKLILDNKVSVTWPLLITRVSDLCGRRKEIKVLVIWIPRQYKSGVERIRIGCPMTDILNRFWRRELPGRLAHLRRVLSAVSRIPALLPIILDILDQKCWNE